MVRPTISKLINTIAIVKIAHAIIEILTSNLLGRCSNPKRLSAKAGRINVR